MIALALVLLILVLLFSVAIVLSNPDIYQLSLFRVLVPVTSAGVFFTGFGAALVTIIAVLLLRTGIRRSRATRHRLRTAEQSAPRGSDSAGDSSDSTGSGGGRPADGRAEDQDSEADRHPTSGGGDGGDRVRRAAGARSDRPDPPSGSSAFTPDPAPGEDETTVPANRRTPTRLGDDRDQPRI